MIALVNNFGFSPTATAGALTFGNTGADQLAELVILVGQTGEEPGLDPIFNMSQGITSTVVSGSNNRVVAYMDALSLGNDDAVRATFILSKVTPAFLVGNWLVQASPATPVPEPATLTLFGTGILGLMGWAARRKRR